MMSFSINGVSRKKKKGETKMLMKLGHHRKPGRLISRLIEKKDQVMIIISRSVFSFFILKGGVGGQIIR